MAQARKANTRNTRKPRSLAFRPGWKLQDAKARFSEVVRRAREEGPYAGVYNTMLGYWRKPEATHKALMDEAGFIAK